MFFGTLLKLISGETDGEERACLQSISHVSSFRYHSPLHFTNVMHGRGIMDGNEGMDEGMDELEMEIE